MIFQSLRKTVLSALVLLLLPEAVWAAPGNIAQKAKVTSSGSLSEAFDANNVTDGRVMWENTGEWACKGHVTSWGEMYLPWVRLDWDEDVIVNRVVVYDRPSMEEHLSGGTLLFSDGSRLSVTAIPNDGSPKELVFEPKTIRWIRFDATDGNGKNIGLSEIEVFPYEPEEGDFTNWVDPLIETTRGRWFYCTPGGRPMGMVAAHAFNRVKNQGGGGYNYNFPYILGFSQINDWMISGLNIMPIEGEVNPLLGMEGWKSSFSHESETIHPGYHKLFLDRYKTWVEYTATDRVALYRLSYAPGSRPGLLVDAGSVLGSCTMRDAVLNKVDEHTVEGHFMTTDRFWGGPDEIGLYFVLKSDAPITDAESWTAKWREPDPWIVTGDGAGMLLRFDKDVVNVKIAMSYTSVENARENLAAEAPGWDFDAVAKESEAIWNEAFGKIEVSGGTHEQKVKFYTDLWHVLLGRHKINDVNGFYPDYTYGEYVNNRTSAPMRVLRLPLNEDGTPVHNMYGFDSLWLSQWNLNTLWGLAWPEILDDFSACLVQYAANGGLLPRGACAGGYSFIMTGCPASNMITSTFLKGILTKTDPEEAFQAVKRNHLPGGMMSFDSSSNLEFYIENGWCPENAGKTLEWAFQDWGLSRMAKKLGHEDDAREFERRSHGWTALFDPEECLVFPKDKDGNWVHKEPLNGRGWVESNAWQATWSVSHDIGTLVKLMGGKDRFCDKLNEAFEKSKDFDFVYAYSSGYVSYANQPGCSNAHVFSHAGKPWMTQYWVRRVNEQAYGGTTPDLGYGGHDEDQGQMGGISALMSIGLFSVTGTETDTPCYDITSPVFDKVVIHLNQDYYPGKEFTIKVKGNPDCYIQNARLNGRNWKWSQFSHEEFAKGGVLELTLGPKPATSWGSLKY